MDVRLEDAGEYGIEVVFLIKRIYKVKHVQAENALGRDYTHCVVRITDATASKSNTRAIQQKAANKAPLITRPLQDCKVHVGNQLLLECEVQTNAESTFEWCHNGQLLAESQTLRTYFDGRLALLKIFNANQDHQGEYEFCIENKDGKTSSNANVSVEGNLFTCNYWHTKNDNYRN